MSVFITVDRSDLQDVVSGPGSFLIFQETSRKQGSGSISNQVSDLTNFHRVKQSLINTSIQQTAPGQQVPSIPVGRAPFPSQQGPSSITGTFTKTSAPTFDELYWRNLIFSRQPTITAQTVTTVQHLSAVASSGFAAATFTQGADGTFGKVIATLSGTASADKAVTITGTNRIGETIQEEVSFTTLTETTTNWFVSVDGIRSTGVSLGSDTVALSRSTDGYQEILMNPGGALLNGLTIVQVLGQPGNSGKDIGVVDTFYDCYFQSVNFSFSREGVIEETWTVVGREATLNSTPDRSGGPQTFVDTEVNDADALGTGVAFRDSDTRAASGWQSSMYFQNSADTRLGFALIDATLTANANVNFTPRTGQRPPGVPYKRTTEITLNFTTEYHRDYDDLVQAQLDARTMDDVEIEIISAQYGSFPNRKRLIFKQLEFTDPLTRVIDSDDFIRLTGTARALPSTPSALDDIVYRNEVEATTDWAGIETSEQDTTGGQLRYYP